MNSKSLNWKLLSKPAPRAGFRKLALIFTCALAFVSFTGHAQMSVTVLVNNIDIPISTTDHYQNGNSTTVLSAVRVSSASLWDLSAKVLGPYTNGAYSIPANAIGVDVLNPIGNQQPERLLAVTDQLIVDAAESTYILLVDFPVDINMVFRATGGSDYLSKPAGAYSGTIVYTISAN